MIRVRPAAERGHRNHGWLDTWHSFSFGDYYDPEHGGWSILRVLNEDIVQPGMGFPTHPHRDMEIVTWILSGSLEHRDSMGNGSVITPGEVQRMSAGTGVSHSEFNASRSEPVHLLQIWLFPERKGLAPGYEQRRIEEDALANRLAPLATPEGVEGSVRIHCDASLRAGRWEPGHAETLPLVPDRTGWAQVVRGRLRLGSVELGPGDGAALSDETEPRAEALESAEWLFFDLPGLQS